MLKTQLNEAVRFIRSKTSVQPKLAIILGSGLGPFAEEVQDQTAISTSSIPNYPASTVEGHAGKWIFGDIEGKTILAMKGRVHSYEGYPLQKVTFPLQLMAQLGIEKLIVTNAAGGHNPRFSLGDLMLITDHINLMFDNPLIGPNELGPRFPDMCEPYNAELIALAERTALDLGIKLQKGVLAALKGPAYETASRPRALALVVWSWPC